MYHTPTEAEEKIQDIIDAVGDRGKLTINHERKHGRIHVTNITLSGLDYFCNLEEFIRDYGMLITHESYENEGVTLFTHIFREY